MWLLLRGILMSRAGVFAMAALAAVSWLKMHDYNLRKDERSRVVAKIEQKANANAEKADAARDSVKSLPVDRLRDAYTRD